MREAQPNRSSGTMGRIHRSVWKTGAPPVKRTDSLQEMGRDLARIPHQGSRRAIANTCDVYVDGYLIGNDKVRLEPDNDE